MSNHVYTSDEIKSMQQPLDSKTGYSNPTFDKLYPDKKNPFHGTERDLANKKGTRMVSMPAEAWQRIFGKKNE